MTTTGRKRFYFNREDRIAKVSLYGFGWPQWEIFSHLWRWPLWGIQGLGLAQWVCWGGGPKGVGRPRHRGTSGPHPEQIPECWRPPTCSQSEGKRTVSLVILRQKYKTMFEYQTKIPCLNTKPKYHVWIPNQNTMFEYQTKIPCFMASLSYGRIFCLEFQKIDCTYQLYNHYFEFFLLEFYFFYLKFDFSLLKIEI